MKKEGRFEKKDGKRAHPLGAAAAFVCMAAAVVLAGNLLLSLQPDAAGAEIPANAGILDRFDAGMTNRRSDALAGVLEVRKVYSIGDDVRSVPKPDPACYGTAADPAQMQEILEQASAVLEGQSMYFSTETELAKGSEIRYYLDDSIFAVVWKEAHDNCVYTMAEVKVVHPSQFRRYLAGDAYGSEKQFTTTEMAADVNAVLASSGDFYRFRNFGAIVYEGQARRLVSRGSHSCFIDKNGDLRFSHAGEIQTMEELQAYVDENNIRFSLAFGPILIENGENVAPYHYEIGEVDQRYARAALCQMDKLHYLVVTANAEGDYRSYHSIPTFAENLMNTGCKMAYTLDGGQTATIAMEGEVINQVSYGTQRKISDIIYFATAVPNGG